MDEGALGKAYDGRLMRRLVAYLRPYRFTVLLSLIFLLVQSGTQVAGPLLTKLAIDKYLASADTAAARAGLLATTALYFLTVLAGFVCEFAETYLMQKTASSPCSTSAAS